jgi:hypothetical protein
VKSAIVLFRPDIRTTQQQQKSPAWLGIESHRAIMYEGDDMGNSGKTLVVLFSVTLGANAQAALLNELQPNPSGGDPATTTVEIRGTSGASFSGSFLSIESDFAGATIDRVNPVSGIFDSNGLITATMPDLENPSFTAVLVDGFTGSVGDILDTNNDGFLDLNPWNSVHDAVGVPDSVSDQSWVYGAQLGGQDFAYTGDEPQLIFRDVVSTSWYAINDPAGQDAYDIYANPVDLSLFSADATQPTFGAANPTRLQSSAMINEFEPNPPGSDPSTATVELRGPAGTEFSASILSLESDADGATIDRATTVSGIFDTNGLLTVSIPDLENPSFTLLLVYGFSGSIGDSLDLDNDGILDLNPWNLVLDALGVPDFTSDESRLYGAQLGGKDFSYTGDEPKIVFRDGQTLLWYAINDPPGTDAFDINANPVARSLFDIDPASTTYGRINPTLASPSAVPVPAAVWLFGSALFGLAGFSKRNKTT